MKKERRTSFCPHHGYIAPQCLAYRYETEEKDIDSNSRSFGPSFEVQYFFAVCETCKQPLLYSVYPEEINDADRINPNTGEEDSDFQMAELLWPRQGLQGGGIPDSVKQCYEEALRLKPISPRAFAGQIRLALEALCDDRKAVRGGLEKRLKDLADKGEIPSKLAEITDVIRVLGNVAAHEYQRALSSYDASVIDEFFRVLVEYLYVAPHRLNEYRTMLSLFGKSKPLTDKPNVESEEDSVPKPKPTVH